MRLVRQVKTKGWETIEGEEAGALWSSALPAAGCGQPASTGGAARQLRQAARPMHITNRRQLRSALRG